MSKKLIGYVILANLLFSALFTISIPADEVPWWDESFSFQEEIIIPIDTSNEHARFQPIDIQIKFNESCWAKNENEHSVRVCYWDGVLWHPLESQIYDLEFIDSDHINSCSLVFLIPNEANGKERYFVYYDDDTKSNPNYPNHVDVDEDYYLYEQIPGLVFESEYYKITEKDYIVYAINKEGEALGESISQQVAKLKKGSENVKPNAGEMGASFSFGYWWMVNGKWRGGPPYVANRFVKGQIFVDGNLMVKVGVESISDNEMLKSTVIYKYYYCPTENKRMYTHVRHEVIDYPLPTGERIDVGYINLNYGNLKSSTIKELNFGKIYPYLHLYSEEERIKEYSVPQYPEGDEPQPIILKEENPDLGSIPWVSIDDGENGKAHAIIFEKTNVTKSGAVGKDAITIELWELNNVNYPGLNARLAFLYILRDPAEEGGELLKTLPEDYVVEFNAEFFTTENGGYPAVAEEAKLYQSLIQFQPIDDDDINDDEEDTERYNLTASVHFAPSFPLGFYISTALELNISYLSAEIYKENSIDSSGYGTVTRIPLKSDLPSDFRGLGLLELLTLFNWNDISFFKKVTFSNLEKGRYLIKIFRENPLLRKEKQFIGYTIVDLDENKETRIFCKNEGKVSLTCLNQDNTGIENVKLFLKKDDFIFAYGESDSEGKITVKAPSGLNEKYLMNVVYKGFLINEEEIRLGVIRRLFPLKRNLNFNAHDFEITVRDSDGKKPDFNIDLSLTSEEMFDPVTIKADSISDGKYQFQNLYPAEYNITIKYKSFEIKKKIKIPDIKSLEIKLNDFTTILKDTLNLSLGVQIDVTLVSEDFEKTVVLFAEELSPGEYHFSDIYPGKYLLKLRYKSFSLEKSITIPYGENDKMTTVFPAIFNVTTTILDARGTPIRNADVLFTRGSQEIRGDTDEAGKILFSIPPGTYHCAIYTNGDLIAQRNINVMFEISYKVATKSEPLFPLVVIFINIVILIVVIILSYKKRDLILFLKILAILLAIIAIVSPWWNITGSASNPHFETSTKLYLVPTEMITIISNNNVSAGELASLDNSFTDVVSLFPIMITISILCIFANLIFNKYKMKKSSILVFLLAILFIIGSNIVFYIAMSELGKVTVGNFLGSGDINFAIPGENMDITISSSWGPDLGFYLLIGSVLVLILSFCLYLKSEIFDKKKKS
jgi:hypothetical protein